MLVSIGGDEKVIIVWQKDAGSLAKNAESWKAAWKQKDAHPDTINYLTTYKAAKGDDLYFTTMCSSGVLKIWAVYYDQQGAMQVNLKSELLFGRNLQEVTELVAVSESDLILLTGGYDAKVHVYMTARGSEPSELRY